MKITLPDSTVRDIKAFLAQSGQNLDVTEFVKRSVHKSMLAVVVGNIYQRNQSEDSEELDRVIDDAVRDARENRDRAE